MKILLEATGEKSVVLYMTEQRNKTKKTAIEIVANEKWNDSNATMWIGGHLIYLLRGLNSS